MHGGDATLAQFDDDGKLVRGFALDDPKAPADAVALSASLWGALIRNQQTWRYRSGTGDAAKFDVVERAVRPAGELAVRYFERTPGFALLLETLVELLEVDRADVLEAVRLAGERLNGGGA